MNPRWRPPSPERLPTFPAPPCGFTEDVARLRSFRNQRSMRALDVGRDEAKRNIAPSRHAGRCVGIRLGSGFSSDYSASAKKPSGIHSKSSTHDPEPRTLPTIETEGRAGWTNRSRRISEIWRSPSGNSAARPYGMAMDFWLMAEQMVLEMMAATARMQDKATSAPPLPSSRRPAQRGSRGEGARARRVHVGVGRTSVRYGAGLLALRRAPRVGDDARRDDVAATGIAQLRSVERRTSQFCRRRPIWNESARWPITTGKRPGAVMGERWTTGCKRNENMLSMMAAEAERNARSAAANDDASTSQTASGSEKPGAEAVSDGRTRTPTSVGESGPT